ncbi:HlyD family efflux transporter periplasmic adaptor subunit, partial [Vibrio cholerae]|nr:HlyD family efflux transporter periplasmic adaptor subunit [Vibrio cholerae]
TYEQSKEEFLKSIDELNMIDESLSLLKEEVHILKSDLASIPHELKSELLTVEVLISELKNDLKKLESNHAFVKVAPESGYISTIHPNKGSHINENSLLLSIIPVDSSLIAEFLLPSRSSGFVKHSNKVKVRFDAFPYQKFGFIEGEVISIDDSLTLPSQNDLPIALNEPIYRIRVKLSANSIKAYGQNFKLKIGMMASADIILENRSLLDWILEPIYTIKGNI